ncbi:MAG TPA: hypothetical protein VFI13_01505 [Gemmatimonadales bacterium]|nr:hypothetical protein [Gemmatimonadales bacterium]
MLLVIPTAAFAGFAASLLLWLGVVVHQTWVRRGGGSPSARSLWWRRSSGQLTFVFFVAFVVTRVYYFL